MGSMIGSSSRQQSDSRLDPDIKAEFFSNLGQARGVANNLGVQQFAPRTGDYLAGAGMTRRVASDGSPGMTNLNMGANLTAANAVTRSVDGLDAYMNPYLQTVAGNTLNDLGRANTMALNSVRGDAVGARAFGGSRQALAEAETNRNFADRASSTLGNIYSQGFNTAAGLQSADLNRFLQAGQQLANLGVTQQQQGFQNAAALTNLGLSDQQFEQQKLDAARNLELERQAIRNQALGLNPAGGSGMQTQSGGRSGSGLMGLGGK